MMSKEGIQYHRHMHIVSVFQCGKSISE